MSLMKSISALEGRVRTSPFRNVIVWGVFFLVFIFIYGSMLVRGGYHWDETLDYAGNGLDTYIANGRWGLALWRAIFGMGCSVWASGILAGLFLTISLVVQTRMLRLERISHQLVYGIIYMVQIQFAYQMDYNFQCDVTALGLLAVSAAAWMVEKGGWRRVILASLLVTFAVSVYQNLALNFIVLLTLLLVRNLLRGGRTKFRRRILTSGTICLIAVVLWYAIKKVVLALVYVDPNTLAFCNKYVDNICNHDLLFSPEWYLYIWYWLCEMVAHAWYPHMYPGESVYASAIIPVVILAIVVSRRAKGFIRKACGVLAIMALWLAPFCMYMVIGEIWPCAPHTKLTQPMVLAGLWILLIAHCHWHKIFRTAGIVALGAWVMMAASLVSRHSADLQARFEGMLMKWYNAEMDGVRVAVTEGIPLEKGRILYYANNRNWDIGYVDFVGDYPALRYMKCATDWKLYNEHKNVLEEMNLWPQNGGIRIVGDKEYDNDGNLVKDNRYVIIKAPEV